MKVKEEQHEWPMSCVLGKSTSQDFPVFSFQEKERTPFLQLDSSDKTHKGAPAPVMS